MKGWKVGSCGEIRQQLSKEVANLDRGILSKLDREFEELKELLMTSASLLNLEHTTLAKDYGAIQRQLAHLDSLLTKDCQSSPRTISGRNEPRPDFQMRNLECLRKDKLKAKFTFLAVTKDNRSQQIFDDNKEHLLAKFCLEDDQYFRRNAGIQTWLRTTISYCINYDLYTKKFFSYQSKKSSNDIDFEETFYNLQYTYTYLDPQLRRTPGGITASAYISAAEINKNQETVEDLFIPKMCRKTGQSVFHHRDDYFKLVPAP